MTEIGKKLKTVLEGYATFLRKRELVLPRHQQHLCDPNLLLPCWGRELDQVRVNTAQNEPFPMLIRSEERSRQPPSLRLPVHAMRNEKKGRDRASFLLVRQNTRLHDERGYHRAGMGATIAERASDLAK